MRYFLNITLLYILAGDEEWIRRIVWKFICIFCWSKIILHKRGTWPPRKNYYFHNGSKVRHLNVRTNKMWRATLVDIGWFLWAKNINQDQQLLYLPTSNLSIRPWRSKHIRNVRLTSYHLKSPIITTHQWSCGKVMVWQGCVCLYMGRSPYEHYPWCIGPHCTGSPWSHPQDMRHGDPLAPAIPDIKPRATIVIPLAPAASW